MTTLRLKPASIFWNIDNRSFDVSPSDVFLSLRLIGQINAPAVKSVYGLFELLEPVSIHKAGEGIITNKKNLIES